MNEQITVNGEPAPLRATTVAALLQSRGVRDERGVAVAVNGAVVPRRRWENTALAAGDDVEIIKVAVGG